MITIEKLRNGNYLIEGERDEMNSLKYQVYICDKISDYNLKEILKYLKTLNSFEQIELNEKSLILLYKLISYFDYDEYNVFKENNDKLKEILLKNTLVKRYLAIEKLKNNIKVK